jgi:hypothetical protein
MYQFADDNSQTVTVTYEFIFPGKLLIHSRHYEFIPTKNPNECRAVAIQHENSCQVGLRLKFSLACRDHWFLLKYHVRQSSFVEQ